MSDASQTPIRIDTGDLYSPQVNEFVEMHQALRRDTGPIDPQPLVVRIIYSSWFYLSIASRLGGFVGLGDHGAILPREGACVTSEVTSDRKLLALSRGRRRHRLVPWRRRRDHVPQSVDGHASAGSSGWGSVSAAGWSPLSSPVIIFVIM